MKPIPRRATKLAGSSRSAPSKAWRASSIRCASRNFSPDAANEAGDGAMVALHCRQEQLHHHDRFRPDPSVARNTWFGLTLSQTSTKPQGHTISTVSTLGAAESEMQSSVSARVVARLAQQHACL